MNELILSALEPGIVWELFEKISAIPRKSKHEEKIRQWLIDWANENSIDYSVDDTGNVLLRREATKGYEDYPVVILQAHMDMVCVKTPESPHDFSKDPIPLIIKDGVVTADGTSLGADNGIGMAIALACLVDPDIERGPIEVLMTVDEETGLTGAFGLKKGFFTGKYLINVDSEDIGEITISSAGGGDSHVELHPEKKSFDNHQAKRIEVRGLKGGHSGVDIHLPLLNSIKVITSILKDIGTAASIAIKKLEGGSAHNAIPRSAECVFLYDTEKSNTIQQSFDRWMSGIDKYLQDEPDLQVTLEEWEISDSKAITFDKSSTIIKLLDELPHGVISYSKDIDGLVETSNNLATVNYNTDSGNLRINLSIRSAKDSELDRVRDEIRTIGEKFGAKVTASPSYPGWEPETDSPFLKLVKNAYERVYGTEIKLRAIHAGLETGLFKKIDPSIQLVSIGPTITSPHSPDERLAIKDVAIIWNTIKLVLKEFNCHL
ncbi:MAG: beta-Ala-His dipeptidase [Candidatus Hodarchaeales archaeon]